MFTQLEQKESILSWNFELDALLYIDHLRAWVGLGAGGLRESRQDTATPDRRRHVIDNNYTPTKLLL